MQTHMQDGLLGIIERLQSTFPGAHIAFVLCVFALIGLVSAPAALWLHARQRASVAPRHRADLEVFRSARRDPLTGLPNRTGFGEALARRLQAGTRSALLLIDLDHFKRVNGAHGHRRGDEVLVAAADRLRQLIPEADQIARLGGDEFGLLLDAARGRNDVEGAALNIMRAMLAPLVTSSGTVDCSASIGVALMPDHGTDADTVLRAAHAAMDDVKAAGGGGFRFFSPVRVAAEQLRTAMQEDLRGAIASGQIIPFYQPIVELRT